MRLLIVDDSAPIRAALRQVAEQHQHVIVGEAENGQEALALLPEIVVDLVLLDMSMPVMGGLATARALQRLAPTLPILFVSQQAEAEYVEAAFRVGASGYLLKSALSSELGPAIESIQHQQPYRSPALKAQPSFPLPSSSEGLS